MVLPRMFSARNWHPTCTTSKATTCSHLISSTCVDHWRISFTVCVEHRTARHALLMVVISLWNSIIAVLFFKDFLQALETSFCSEKRRTRNVAVYSTCLVGRLVPTRCWHASYRNLFFWRLCFMRISFPPWPAVCLTSRFRAFSDFVVRISSSRFARKEQAGLVTFSAHENHGLFMLTCCFTDVSSSRRSYSEVVGGACPMRWRYSDVWFDVVLTSAITGDPKTVLHIFDWTVSLPVSLLLSWLSALAARLLSSFFFFFAS